MLTSFPVKALHSLVKQGPLAKMLAYSLLFFFVKGLLWLAVLGVAFLNFA